MDNYFFNEINNKFDKINAGLDALQKKIAVIATLWVVIMAIVQILIVRFVEVRKHERKIITFTDINPRNFRNAHSNAEIQGQKTAQYLH